MGADVTPKYAFGMVLSRQTKPFLLMSQKLCSFISIFLTHSVIIQSGAISGNLFQNAHSIYQKTAMNSIPPPHVYQTMKFLSFVAHTQFPNSAPFRVNP